MFLLTPQHAPIMTIEKATMWCVGKGGLDYKNRKITVMHHWRRHRAENSAAMKRIWAQSLRSVHTPTRMMMSILARKRNLRLLERCVYMYVCTHVCMVVCMYVYMYVCMYVYIYMCVWAIGAKGEPNRPLSPLDKTNATGSYHYHISCTAVCSFDQTCARIPRGHCATGSHLLRMHEKIYIRGWQVGIPK